MANTCLLSVNVPEVDASSEGSGTNTVLPGPNVLYVASPFAKPKVRPLIVTPLTG